jgi:hypothetical protein
MTTLVGILTPPSEAQNDKKNFHKISINLLRKIADLFLWNLLNKLQVRKE